MIVRTVCRRFLGLLLAMCVFAVALPAVSLVRALSSGQAARLVLGHPSFTEGSKGVKPMAAPRAVAVDLVTGVVFVADTDNNRVLRFATLASLSNGAAPDAVLGQPDLTTNGKATTAQGMRGPAGVAVDGDGRLWVADTGNSRVLWFNMAASKASGAAADGVLGQPGFTSSGSATSAEGMEVPGGVAVDGSGRLWVADTLNNRVLRFDNAADKASGAAADGVLGQPGFTSKLAATTAEGMWSPYGVAVDVNGRLWVADAANSRVLRFEAAAGKPSGAAADAVLGQSSFTGRAWGAGATLMYWPSGVAVDLGGRLWVADSANRRVLRFDAAAGKSSGAAADGVLGQPDFTSDGRATSAQGLGYADGVAVSGDGRLWVADSANNRVLRFNAAAGKPNGAAADGVLGQGNFTTTRPITAALLEAPRGVAVDPTTGKLFVADTNNNRVLRFASHASLISGAPAEAVLGQPDFMSYGAALTAQGMSLPSGVAVDRDGRLWVADTDNYRVLRFDAAAGKTNGAAADGVLGQPDFTSRSDVRTAQQMTAPYGVALDRDGRLWVSDLGNNRVLRFDAAAGKANGAAADGVLGQSTFMIKTRVLSAQGMSDPFGVAVDGDGRLWVADYGNNRVLRFDAAAGKPNGAAADGVLGQPDFTSGASAVSAHGVTNPSGVAVDGDGRLWVVDSTSSRMLWFDAAGGLPNGAHASGVLGQPDFTSGAPATSAQGLSKPQGVAADAGGGVWVADTDNSRVLLFETAEPVLRPQVYLPLVRH